jgi:hypothetical protein
MQNTNYSAVYRRAGNGMAVSTGEIEDINTGVRTPGAVQAGRTVSVAEALKHGCVLDGSRQMSESSLSALNIAQNQQGQPSLVRNEFMADAGGVVRTYRIGFANASGGDVTAVLGDGNTIIFESLGLAPLPGGVTISGTWGANSLAIWKLVTSNTPVRIEKIRINFDNTNYPLTGNLTQYKTRPDAIADTSDQNISTWISPDQFQGLIIENPGKLRVLWDASTGYTALIPNGRTVTFTFFYTSVADVHDMRLIGAKP